MTPEIPTHRIFISVTPPLIKTNAASQIHTNARTAMPTYVHILPISGALRKFAIIYLPDIYSSHL